MELKIGDHFQNDEQHPNVRTFNDENQKYPDQNVKRLRSYLEAKSLSQ